MVKSFWLTFFLITTSISVFSQRETVYQSAQWFAFTTDIHLDKRYSILAEGQFRYVNGLDPMQFQVRTGLDVTVNKHFSFMPVGYVYSWNPIYGKQPATYSNNEHRLFEQARCNFTVGKLSIDNRVRLEQRFMQVHESNNGEIVSKGYTLYLNRLRYRLNLKMPLYTKESTGQSVYACAYDEVFVEFGSSVVYTDPDQNRIFAGLGYKANKRVAVQAGFFRQTLIKLSGDKQETNTGFQIQVFCNLDLSDR